MLENGVADGEDDHQLTGDAIALHYIAAPCCAATRADIIAPGWFAPCTTKAIASQVIHQQAFQTCYFR